MCDDHKRRPSTVPPPPPEAPKTFGSIKKAQTFLKLYGYTLTAFGPYRVSFYRTNVKRTPDGLVPEDQWHHLSQTSFRAFAKRLSGDDES